MKITIEIGGNDYTFELNRAAYKRLLNDKEYAKMQNEISKMVSAKSDKKSAKQIGEEMLQDDITKAILNNLIMEEQVFYYSLTTNHPEITMLEASKLIDLAYEEYGRESVSELTTKLLENFTQREEKPKKQMVMRFN